MGSNFNQEKFSGFFSYAHADVKSDEQLVKMIHSHLQSRVDTKLINASFALWRDIKKLKTGDVWNSEIDSSIKSSHALVIIFSPKWLESKNCMREMMLFHDAVEKSRGKGTYIAPILIRSFDNQFSHFSKEQREIYDELMDRQHSKMLSSDMLCLDKNEKLRIIDKVADDIAGMIERWRLPSSNLVVSSTSTEVTTKRKRVEFDHQAHDFAKVDPISDAEILVDPVDGSEDRGVYAYIDCIPRMYIQTQNVRVEFSIRRAFLTIDDADSNLLTKNPKMQNEDGGQRCAYYIKERGSISSISICIDPKPGDMSIKENPLPPTEGENRLAKIAVASPLTVVDSIKAKISIRLNAEGLFIFSSDPNQTVSASTVKNSLPLSMLQLKAIN